MSCALVRVCVRMHVCNACMLDVCMYACTYVCTYVCRYVRYVCKFACLYACMYVRSYASMHVCTYTCKYACVYLYACLSQGGFWVQFARFDLLIAAVDAYYLTVSYIAVYLLLIW